MSLMRVNPRSYMRLSTIFREGKRLYSVVAKQDEYSDPPQYPPILDLSIKAKEKRRHQSWHEAINKLDTVEEKLMKINMPRYYGWKSLMLTEHMIPYNSESLAQFITRTHLIQEPGLPKYYDRVMAPERMEEIVQRIKKQIEEAVLLEYNYRKREQELEAVDKKNSEVLINARTEALVRHINRILLATLASDLPHLLEAQIDDKPRIEAFWFAGGIEPPKAVRKSKASLPWLKDHADDPVDTRVQYKGEPILQLRHDLPLKEIVSLSESENPVFTVPEFRFDPRVLGYEFEYVHGTNIPGFWPGDPSEFGLMSYLNRNHIDKRLTTFKDDEDALNVQAIYASYSWLLSQACYQGFSTFTDLTYPLLTQTVITNGQSWSLYAYQLNTTLVYSEHADTNPRRNLCWTSGSMKLFEGIEDGKLVGLNDDVLKTLIKFYANVPQKRKGVNMKPYLGTSEQKIADIKDPEKRAWLEKYFKHMYSNRPRHFLKEEVDPWKKIYKIDFNTRFMDKKYNKWEFGYRHTSRKYDDHLPTYIPKCLRPEGPRSKKKWAKTYYP